MTLSQIYAIIITLGLGVIGYFLKKTDNKNDKTESRVGSLERVTMKMQTEIDENHRRDTERWRIVEKLVEDFRKLSETDHREHNKIDQKLTKQNALLVIIADKLEVGDLAKQIIDH